MKRKSSPIDNNELSPRHEEIIIKDEFDENLWSLIDNEYQLSNSGTSQFKESIENEIKQETTSSSSSSSSSSKVTNNH